MNHDDFWRLRDISLLTNVQTSSGPNQPTAQLVPGGSSSGVERPGRVAGRLPPCNAEGKNI
jgi:hypothetical protein